MRLPERRHPRPAVYAPVFFLVLLACLQPVTPALAQVDPGLLAGMTARAIGPAGMSGRVADVAAAPSDPTVVYVGAATGGLWKSANGGLSYEPVFDDQPVASVGAIAIHPSDPEVVWVGTGEGNVRNSVSVGNGIYLTRDGGRSWEHLGLDATERITRILIHPGNPDVVYVAALGQEWGENPERGVFRTRDGGATWEKILYVDESTGAADLAIDPQNPEKLFAAMWDYRRWPWFFRSGGPGSGLHVTRDGGDTWVRLTPEDGLPEGELGRIGVAVAPSDPAIVYALIEARENALYRSNDGGISWRMVGKGDNVGNRPFYYADIRVDPEWPDRVYSLWSVISVSDDGGRTFRQLVGWDIHPDHHAMWINPDDASHLIIGNDGGVAISHDRGSTWRFVRNLPLAQFYHIRVDMEQPYNVYGGMQDNGSWKGPSTVLENGGIRNYHWDEVGFGDGFDTAPDPEDPMRGYAMSQEGYLIRWDLRTGERKDIRPPPPEGTRLRFNWNAGFAQDPFDPATIYYGSQFVHRSTDRGESWERISPDLTTNNAEWQKQAESGGLTPDVTGAENFTTILSIAPSPVTPGVLWAGTDDGRLHVTRDGGRSWTAVEGNVQGVPPNTWIPHIEASRFDAGRAYVVFDDHRRSNWTPYVFRTDDFGSRWTRLAGDDDVWGYALSIAEDPVDPDLLFLGTEFGVWVSVNSGRRWFKWTHGIPTVGVRDLLVHPRDHDLVVGTHGRSAFILDDVSPLRGLDGATLEEPLHLFPVSDAVQYRRKQTGASRFPGHGEFRGETRPIGAILSVVVNSEDIPHPDDEIERARKASSRAMAGGTREDEPETDAEEESGGGEARLELEVADSTGATIRSWKVPVHLGLNRVTWNLRRDAFHRPDTGEGADEEHRESGILVLPGTYTLTARFGDLDASASVNVLADPRETATQGERLEKYRALLKAGEIRETLADALSLIFRLRADLTDALAARDRGKEAPAAEAVQGGDEEDDKMLEMADAIRKALKEIEERIWVPEGTKGIVYSDERAWNRINYVLGSLESSWDAPTPAQIAYLGEARAAVEKVLADLQTLYDGDVERFRTAIRAAQLELMPSEEVPELP